MPPPAYSFNPQFATIRSESPLSGMRPVVAAPEIRHTALSFERMQPIQIRSSKPELVTEGIASAISEGAGGALKGITAAYVSEREKGEAADKEALKFSRDLQLAKARSEKTPEEEAFKKQYQGLQLQNLQAAIKRKEEVGGNKNPNIATQEKINYGDIDAKNEKELEALESTEPGMWDLPTLEAYPVDFDLNPLSSIGPTTEGVNQVLTRPLSQLTAESVAGVNQANEIAAMQAGQIPVVGEQMSTDVPPITEAIPALTMTSKYRGMLTPEEAKRIRDEFYSATGEQMTSMGQPLVNVVTPTTTEAPVANKEDLKNYLQTWSDPSVAAKAQGKIKEIMGDDYAPAEIEEIVTESGERAFKVKYPKKLTAKEISESTGTGIDFDTEKKLRDEFIGQSKDFKTIQSAWRSIRTSGSEASAAGDMSLIFGFMKLLDPSSTVREGEYANAQNAAGVPDRIAAAYNKAINGQILADTQRKDFLNQAKKQYDSRLGEYNQLKKEFSRLAKDYSVEPNRVIVEFVMPEPTSELDNLTQQVKSKIAEIQGLPANSEERKKATQELIALRQKLSGLK